MAGNVTIPELPDRGDAHTGDLVAVSRDGTTGKALLTDLRKSFAPALIYLWSDADDEPPTPTVPENTVTSNRGNLASAPSGWTLQKPADAKWRVAVFIHYDVVVVTRPVNVGPRTAAATPPALVYVWQNALSMPPRPAVAGLIANDARDALTTAPDDWLIAQPASTPAGENLWRAPVFIYDETIIAGAPIDLTDDTNSGDNGYSEALIQGMRVVEFVAWYRRAATEPVTPVSRSGPHSTATLAPANGWTEEVPDGSDPLWVLFSVRQRSALTTQLTFYTSYSDPVKLAGGDDEGEMLTASLARLRASIDGINTRLRAVEDDAEPLTTAQFTLLQALLRLFSQEVRDAAFRDGWNGIAYLVADDTLAADGVTVNGADFSMSPSIVDAAVAPPGTLSTLTIAGVKYGADITDGVDVPASLIRRRQPAVKEWVRLNAAVLPDDPSRIVIAAGLTFGEVGQSWLRDPTAGSAIPPTAHILSVGMGGANTKALVRVNRAGTRLEFVETLAQAAPSRIGLPRDGTANTDAAELTPGEPNGVLVWEVRPAVASGHSLVVHIETPFGGFSDGQYRADIVVKEGGTWNRDNAFSVAKAQYTAQEFTGGNRTRSFDASFVYEPNSAAHGGRDVLIMTWDREHQDPHNDAIFWDVNAYARLDNAASSTLSYVEAGAPLEAPNGTHGFVFELSNPASGNTKLRAAVDGNLIAERDLDQRYDSLAALAGNIIFGDNVVGSWWWYNLFVGTAPAALSDDDLIAASRAQGTAAPDMFEPTTHFAHLNLGSDFLRIGDDSLADYIRDVISIPAQGDAPAGHVLALTADGNYRWQAPARNEVHLQSRYSEHNQLSHPLTETSTNFPDHTANVSDSYQIVDLGATGDRALLIFTRDGTSEIFEMEVVLGEAQHTYASGHEDFRVYIGAPRNGPVTPNSRDVELHHRRGGDWRLAQIRQQLAGATAVNNRVRWTSDPIPFVASEAGTSRIAVLPQTVLPAETYGDIRDWGVNFHLKQTTSLTFPDGTNLTTNSQALSYKGGGTNDPAAILIFHGRTIHRGFVIVNGSGSDASIGYSHSFIGARTDDVNVVFWVDTVSPA